MITITNIIFIISLLLATLNDIKEQIIPEKYIRIMFICTLIKNIFLYDYIDQYISISIFVFPIFIIILIETYVNKELLGLGDVKLFILLAMYFSKIITVYFTYKFYTIMYILAGAYILIFRKKEKYIAFAPFISITFFAFIAYYGEF